MKENNSAFDSYRQTRIIIKSNKKLKDHIMKLRIYYSAIHILFIAIFSLILVSFNIFFFLISFLKYLILYSLSLSTIYLLIVNRETAENWQDRSKRNENLKGKIIHLLIEGSILLVLSLLILGIIYLTGYPRKTDEMDIDLGSEGILSRLYIPYSIEAILIVSIIFLLLLSFFTTVFWFSSRCIVNTSYFAKKEMMNTKSKRMYFSLIINWVIWGILLPIFLDLAFFNANFLGFSIYHSLSRKFSNKIHFIFY